MKAASPMLNIETPDGGADVPLTWLRDSCGCGLCVHPNGQRLIDPTTLPADLVATDVRVVGDVLTVVWMPEGHESRYSLEQLRRSPAPPPPVTLWDATDVEPPVSTYPSIVAEGQAMLSWLCALAQAGCALLRHVPVVKGEVARVAELFSHVRETNYGRWFDVRSVVDPDNLADSALGLAPHTDNPYREPVPTLQLLHCLQSTATGGESVLVDGWRVANEVRDIDPTGFELLASRPVTFSYRDATAELIARAALIETDGDGAVRMVRFNPRSMQPPKMPSGLLARWYDAYLLFARLLADPTFQIRFRLDSGDLFVVDNRRVLHGRTAFEPVTGERHLQGCYADIDGLHSTIAVLARTTP